MMLAGPSGGGYPLNSGPCLKGARFTDDIGVFMGHFRCFLFYFQTNVFSPSEAI